MQLGSQMARHVQAIVDIPTTARQSPHRWSLGVDSTSGDDLDLAYEGQCCVAVCVLRNDPHLQVDIRALFANYFDPVILSRHTELPIDQWQGCASQFASTILVTEPAMVVGIAFVTVTLAGCERLRGKVACEDQNEETSDDKSAHQYLL